MQFCYILKIMINKVNRKIKRVVMLAVISHSTLFFQERTQELATN